ncbi:MAG: hypothetical protein HQL84_18400 [Magnetococcales bacterium]|nr:hypothetical protein [Magnetococcales bacterium]MBF0151991.1 hypothetical protein [Magnetococcales bacterium]
MLSQVIMKSLFAYFLLIIIAGFVALIIKGIVNIFTKMGEKALAAAPVAAKPVARPAAVPAGGIPPHHLVAIIAATQMFAGGRILRIEDVGVDSSWTSVGRSMQQSSHNVRR